MVAELVRLVSLSALPVSYFCQGEVGEGKRGVKGTTLSHFPPRGHSNTYKHWYSRIKVFAFSPSWIERLLCSETLDLKSPFTH